MTMTLKEHIYYWVNSASGDWDAAHTLLASNHVFHAMFFIYLSMEKLLKANWILDNGESFPPLTQNLENLYAQTEIELDASEIDLLKLVNTWNIEGRYQDYKNKLAKSYTLSYLKERLVKIETIRTCLLERLL